MIIQTIKKFQNKVKINFSNNKQNKVMILIKNLQIIIVFKINKINHNNLNNLSN